MQPRRLGRQSRGHTKRGRTIPLPGDDDENGHWYKCWSCGMHCNDVTDEQDDGASKVHTTYDKYYRQAVGGYGSKGGMMINFYYIGYNQQFINPHVALANADGTAKEVVYDWKIIDTKGCPNDGNLNWMGSY